MVEREDSHTRNIRALHAAANGILAIWGSWENWAVKREPPCGNRSRRRRCTVLFRTIDQSAPFIISTLSWIAIKRTKASPFDFRTTSGSHFFIAFFSFFFFYTEWLDHRMSSSIQFFKRRNIFFIIVESFDIEDSLTGRTNLEFTLPGRIAFFERTATTREQKKYELSNYKRKNFTTLRAIFSQMLSQILLRINRSLGN